ncbi:glycosyltransferase family 4 protein [Pseudanabaena sp. UWO311]|uniref:glycosyltransferase family 4 protein n=1 Tax=Pseudanabaena sp. UWO311 TaxID=2487337 RepID=UPI00115B259B|nr:glycosyltransferase family 4 protein [Pseudanabaena sp. UWO311]TYQ23365.1 glycosyltransferase family 4 protein [Pseudanabaena sp. UWO311]
MPRTPKIHVWLPDIFQFKGGIQVYSAFLIQALEQVLPDSDRHVFLKNDTHATEDIEFDEQTKISFAGRWKSTFWHTPIFAAQVLLAAIKDRPDLIICGHINFSPLAAKIFNLLKIPYWVIVHGIDAWNIEDKSKIYGLKSAQKIVSVSEYTRDRIVYEQKISPDRIPLLPVTFNDRQFTVKPKPQYLLDRLQLNPDQPTILTVTRLASGDRYKGYDQIIQALPAIRCQIPNICYLLVGKGDDRDRIEAMVDDLDVRDCVTFAGFVPDDELADYYNLCDLFAMPSKGEGFGIVYLEALACGKPTIGGNQDGAIDALCKGELGVLVNPDSIDEIRETIVEILMNKHSLSILYEPDMLRQKAIEKYGFEQFKQNLSCLFQKL